MVILKTLKEKELQFSIIHENRKGFLTKDVKKFIIDLKCALKHEDYIFEDDFASINKLIDKLAGDFQK